MTHVYRKLTAAAIITVFLISTFAIIRSVYPAATLTVSVGPPTPTVGNPIYVSGAGASHSLSPAYMSTNATMISTLAAKAAESS